MITRWAETGLVPPARGVIVSAAALPAGFRTVKMELIEVVVTMAYNLGRTSSTTYYRRCQIRASVRAILREAHIPTGCNRSGIIGRYQCIRPIAAL